ncbi:MAG: hypothetical protein CVT94_13950 [Bacteroidetes bacterium HGW-Bacteroidetes-11]|jgi:hypothetical protein|nr:MAG: hypothetical protein CVT94_13950 [Bacteroidetes bacterium HGW-Bacteroidetes-11]
MKKILFLLFVILISGGCNKKLFIKQSYNSGQYRIKRVEKYNGFFIIYASRNDSVFKIISYKEEPGFYNNFEKIQRRRMYKLELENYYKREIEMGYYGLHLSVTLNILGVKVPVSKKSHYQLYRALNLKGLYLIPDAAPPSP